MSEKSKEQETVDLLNDYREAAAAKDAQKMASFFAEDVDWYIFESPYLPWSGRRSKRSELPELFQAIFDAHADGEERFELDHIFVSGNEAAIFAKAGRKVKATGKSFYADICQRITVKDRLITRFVMFEDSHEIEKAFKPN
jgi:uncharacterized protein